MYQYQAIEQQLLEERTGQFRFQVERYLAGKLSEDEFRPLRLMNGVYLQRHAPMLRVAIPYGLLSAAQLQVLAEIATNYDQGYGHFTTRQNIQFNWIKLTDVPKVLEKLAETQMHAIQTSGNCIRNITSDPLAGMAVDEYVDPRPYCELIRQWSTLHPEFSFLPRKFKIAVTGAKQDRVGLKIHDIGLQLYPNEQGILGFRVYIGGGLGRTPHLGQCLCEFLPETELLSYLEAILRVYNQWGRRDNLYKSRIKILLKKIGLTQFKQEVESIWQQLPKDYLNVSAEKWRILHDGFRPHAYDLQAKNDVEFKAHYQKNPIFAQWVNSVVLPHRIAGYRGVIIPLKQGKYAPGDLNAAQMIAVARLSERYSFGEIRITAQQNLLLADVRQQDLFALWQALRGLQLAAPIYNTLQDIVCCPGLDYCSLANAFSISLAKAIQQHFDELNEVYQVGELQLNISGCVNACGHHHIGHIGILGVEKKGESYYQIVLGGDIGESSALAESLGAALDQNAILQALSKITSLYLAQRESGERFIDTYRRLGINAFKEVVYGHH